MKKLYFVGSFIKNISRGLIFAAAALAPIGLVGLAGAAAPTLLTPKLAHAQLNIPYSQALLVGGNPPPTDIEISGLPTGLRYQHNGSGAITIGGTPLNAGRFDLAFTISTANGAVVKGASFGAVLTVRDADLSASGATSVAVGAGSCAVVAGGVQCWTASPHAKVIDGAASPRADVARVIAAGSNATAVNTSGHSCAVVAGGVQCWGTNEKGRLGVVENAPLNTPKAAIAAGSGASAVAVGFEHSCAVVNSELQCWGDYPGSLTRYSSDAYRPSSAIAAGSGVSAIAASYGSTCAVVQGGVKCWGYIKQAMVNDAVNPATPAALQVIAANQGVTAVALANAHGCALSNGGVMCWGHNTNGQLGDGSKAVRLAPVWAIAAGSGVTAIATGGDFSCAVMAGGLTCWGKNSGVKLPSGHALESAVPTKVLDAGSGVLQVAISQGYSCAVVRDAVKCWGTTGQVGDLDFFGSVMRPLQDRPALVVPAVVAADTVSLALGHGHSCAAIADAVKCWGRNHSGQLGDGSLINRFAPVVTIPSAQLPAQKSYIATGASHTCAVVDGGVGCWGDNTSAQLSLGSQGSLGIVNSRTVPAEVFPVRSGASAIATGDIHTCAVIAGGVQCWGGYPRPIIGLPVPDPTPNRYGGLLGNGSAAPSAVPVVAIAAAGGATHVAVGSRHSCAVVDGGVQCWGENWVGQLGDGTSSRSLVPVQVIPSRSGVSAIAATGARTCAVLGDGLRCWGSNEFGALGDGTTVTRPQPVQILPMGSAVTAVSVGNNHTCAVVDGGLKCWGWNARGQLGDGSTTDRLLPVDIMPAGAGVTAVGAGYAHTCAVVNANILCWGANSVGQLALALPVVAEPHEIHFLAPTPKPLVFPALYHVGLNTDIVSDPQLVSGLDSFYPISIVGGSYLVDCNASNRLTGDYVSTPSTVMSNQAVCVKIRSGGNSGETRELTLTVGAANGIIGDSTVSKFIVVTFNPSVALRNRAYVPATYGHLLITNFSVYWKLVFPENTQFVGERPDHALYTEPATKNGVTTVPHYRLLNLRTGRYLWTGNAAEYALLRADTASYKDEGIDVYIFPTNGVPNTVPLYRLRYAPLDILHWTADTNEVQHLLKHGWEALGEARYPAGVVGYVWPMNLGYAP